MLIKPLDDYKKYDIFLGYGWENWIRVKMDKSRVEVVKTNIEELDASTLRLIYFKLKRLIDREKGNKDGS